MSGKRWLSLVLTMMLVLSIGYAQAGKRLTMKEIQAATEGMSDEELRAWCAERYAASVHSDPAEIPWPDNRQEDGYLPEGEFVHEDPEKGLWAYLSDSLQVIIVKHQLPEIPHTWFEAEVIFKPEEEIFTQHVYVNAKFKGQQIWPETLAQTSRIIFAVNGDYHDDRVSQKRPTGNIIRQGVAMYNHNPKRSLVFPNLDTLAIRNDGSFQVFAGDEITADELLAEASPEDPAFVHDALSFGPYLVRDGKIRFYDGKNAENPEPRSAYGMIAPGHLFFVMAEGKMPKKTEEQGMDLWELAELMYARGCTEAMNVDGGSTATMIFMGERLHRTGKGIGKSLGSPRNQFELFGIGESELVHTDKVDGPKKK